MTISYPRVDVALRRDNGPSVKITPRAYPMQEVAAQIFAAGCAHGIRHIMLAGVTRMVGTSFVVEGLADSICAGGLRVLVIELRAGSPDGMNLPRLLAEPEAASVEQKLKLHVGADEVMMLIAPGSGLFEQASVALRNRFDVVLWDLPPPGQTAPTAVAARLMDGVILVARSERTTRRALRYAVSRYRIHDARILGVVLNQMSGRGARWHERLA